MIRPRSERHRTSGGRAEFCSGLERRRRAFGTHERVGVVWLAHSASIGKYKTDSCSQLFAAGVISLFGGFGGPHPRQTTHSTEEIGDRKGKLGDAITRS
jgi:hypothetical protein